MNEEQFKEWLKREMPEGTVIGTPEWWAKKIWQAALSAKSVPCDHLFVAKQAEGDLSSHAVCSKCGLRPMSQAPTDDERVRELEKDAARYRWLRNKANLYAKKGDPMVCLHPLDNQILIDGSELDEAIDQAMNEANK